MGLFTIFGTTLRALNTYSGAMGVVANNIANAANEDYSRQRVEFETLTPDKFGGFETGRGLGIASVAQVVNVITESRLNSAYQDLGMNDARAEYLSTIEGVLNEVAGDGLSASISEFFSAWTAVSADPANLTARQNVLNAAENMIDLFNTYSESLSQTRTAVDEEIQSTVPAVNNLLTQIAELNQKILDSGQGGGLSLRDERRRLVNELAEYVDVNYIEDGTMMQVYTKSGLPLVNNTNYATFSNVIDVTNDNLNDIYYSIGGSVPADVTGQITGGRLAGLVNVRDVNLKDYQDRLDDLAYTLATEVNNDHTTGYDLAGNTGVNFFTPFAAVVPVYDNAARLISLDPAVDGQPEALALSANAADVPGGNTIALSIANLYDSSTIAFGGGSTNSFAGHFGDFMGKLGNDTLLATSKRDFSQSVIDQVKLERMQESGVSVDEEQINLIKMQAAYEASGRMIKIADSIIETLINALV